MTVLELMKSVAGEGFQTEGTVDCFKYGDIERKAEKVATCMTATPDVLKAAKEWGADLIITHEPTYYTHTDEFTSSPIADKKLALVKECDIPLCRFHDHMHWNFDMISDAFLKVMGWKGEFDGNMKFVLDEPKTPMGIAKEIEEKLNLRHVRIVGKRDGEVTGVGLYLGHRGDWDAWGPFKDLTSGCQVGIGGEWCEWANGEWIRDAAQFGIQLTAIMLGHAGSEKVGMQVLADSINEKYAADGIEAKYFDCGELFTYTDD